MPRPSKRWSSLVLRLAGVIVIAVVTVIMVAAGPARAAETPTSGSPSGSRTLRVGTKEAPPFVVRRPDGSLDGPSIRLWRELAADLGVAYTLEERDLGGLLAGLRDGSLDVAVAAITVTSEREATIDFSHPFHTAGLGIVVRERDVPLWLGVLGTIVSSALLQLVVVLAGLQLLVGTIVWLVERRANPRQFGEPGLRGLLTGFWWSTVTMTTVGYGDKAPVTVPGRVIALGWMLCSVVIISTFTATVASRMTVAQLGAEISGPSDLVGMKVAVVSNTTSERYARGADLDFRRMPDLDAALDAVADERVDAVIHDAPLLQQLLRGERGEGLELLPVRFQRQDYAIALRDGSELREPINRLLPDKLRGSELGDPSLADLGP